MDFGTSVKTCFSKYVTFSGRASRSEYWWFALAIIVGNIVLSIVDSTLFGTVTTYDGGFTAETNSPVFSGLWILASFLPAVSVAVRRLHDTGRSGWWYWIVLVPLVGGIILIVFLATKGTDGENQFGDDPLDGSGGGFDGGPDTRADGNYRPSSIPKVSG